MVPRPRMNRSSVEPPSHRADIAPGLPLFRVQEGVWFGQQRDPDCRSYVIGSYTDIRGPLNEAVFISAAQQLVAEMEAARTWFEETPAGPVQRVGEPFGWTPDVHDFSAETDPVATARSWMQARVPHAFDLTQRPLFHFALLRLGEGRWFWFQVGHHLILDGYCALLLARRTAVLYEARLAGREPETPPVAPIAELLQDEVNYRNSASWQRDREHWLRVLEDRPEPVRLTRRRTTRLGGFVRRELSMSPALSDALEARARAAGGSMGDAIMAAVAWYLYRLTGERDLLLAVPVLGRVGRKSRETPTMLANVVPARIAVTPGDAFEHLVAAVARAQRGALRHQRFPREELRRALGLGPNDDDVAAITVNSMPFDLRVPLGECDATMHNLTNGPVADLSFVCYHRRPGEATPLHLNGHADLYTVDELAAHGLRLVRLLEGIGAQTAGVPLAGIALISPAEADRGGAAGTRPARKGGAAGETLPALFEQQATRTPAAIAVRGDDEALTYAELDARANRLAWRLRQINQGPGTVVGVAHDGTVGAAVALLAVLKAGAAYLPLDPAEAVARRNEWLRDSGAGALLTPDGNGAEAAGGWIEMAWRDTPPGEAVNRAMTDADRTRILRSDDLAGVIYREGPAGRTQGVGVRQTGAVHLWHEQREAFAVESDSRVLQFAVPAFDGAVSDWMMGWAAGATLVVAKRGAFPDPLALMARCEREQVTHLVLPLATLAQLNADALGTVQMVVVTGETCPTEVVRRFASGRRVVKVCGSSASSRVGCSMRCWSRCPMVWWASFMWRGRGSREVTGAGAG